MHNGHFDQKWKNRYRFIRWIRDSLPYPPLVSVSCDLQSLSGSCVFRLGVVNTFSMCSRHALPWMAVYGRVWPCMAISFKMAMSNDMAMPCIMAISAKNRQNRCRFIRSIRDSLPYPPLTSISCETYQNRLFLDSCLGPAECAERLNKCIIASAADFAASKPHLDVNNKNNDNFYIQITSSCSPNDFQMKSR